MRSRPCWRRRDPGGRMLRDRRDIKGQVSGADIASLQSLPSVPVGNAARIGRTGRCCPGGRKTKSGFPIVAKMVGFNPRKSKMLYLSMGLTSLPLRPASPFRLRVARPRGPEGRSVSGEAERSESEDGLPRPGPETSVTDRTRDMGDSRVPIGSPVALNVKQPGPSSQELRAKDLAQ
jgi:hypothetical protein